MIPPDGCPRCGQDHRPAMACAAHWEEQLTVFTQIFAEGQGVVDRLDQDAVARYLFHRPHGQRAPRSSVVLWDAAPTAVAVVTALVTALLAMIMVMTTWIR